MKLPIYNSNGEKVKDKEVSSVIFGAKINVAVVHQAVVAQMANAREVLADTKDRSEVSGGGKKPWKQKGTGRARHGSSRSPIWVGGGITFGPTNDRNFSVKINKKQKQLAMAMCISDKVAEETFVTFEKMPLDDGKTKTLVAWLKEIKTKMPSLAKSKKYLIITSEADEKVIRPTINTKNARAITADSLNCVDLLKYDTILATEESISKIEKHYTKIKEKKSK